MDRLQILSAASEQNEHADEKETQMNCGLCLS